MRKHAFSLSENKGAFQLCGQPAADQRLCFRYIDSIISLLPNSKFHTSSHHLWLYNPVCDLVGNPDTAHLLSGVHVINPFFGSLKQGKNSYQNSVVVV